MSKDGGPAFPVTPTDKSGQIGEVQYGMSLRDWFAGQALRGMILSFRKLRCARLLIMRERESGCWISGRKEKGRSADPLLLGGTICNEAAWHGKAGWGRARHGRDRQHYLTHNDETGELEDLGLLAVEPDVEEAFALIKGRIVKGGKEVEDE